MFKKHAALGCINECHYTCDSAIVYTYVHFGSPVSLKALAAFMDMMKLERQMILFQIFGYDAIATSHSDDGLVDHVGFQVLLDHYMTKNPSFKSCTNGVDGVVRGLLWRSDVVNRVREYLQKRSKAFGDYFSNMEKQLAEYKQKAEMVDLMQEEMMEHEANLQLLRERVQRQHALINELKRAEFVAFVLKYRISHLDQATKDILLAPDDDGRPIEWA